MGNTLVNLLHRCRRRRLFYRNWLQTMDWNRKYVSIEKSCVTFYTWIFTKITDLPFATSKVNHYLSVIRSIESQLRSLKVIVNMQLNIRVWSQRHLIHTRYSKKTGFVFFHVEHDFRWIIWKEKMTRKYVTLNGCRKIHTDTKQTFVILRPNEPRKSTLICFQAQRVISKMILNRQYEEFEFPT